MDTPLYGTDHWQSPVSRNAGRDLSRPFCPPGETDAAAVVSRYGDTVYRLAHARTGSRADADDVFQEVFIRYIRKKPDFKDEEHAKAWFIRVTINCAAKLTGALRRKQGQPLEETAAAAEPAYNEEYAVLMQCLSALPAAYREVVHLFYFEDMPVAHIAAVLRRKESTVRMQLTRARRSLKEMMEGEMADD